MRDVTLIILGLLMCLAFMMCRESRHDPVVESTLLPEQVLYPPPLDSTLPKELQKADSLIQWRDYPNARKILNSFIESHSGSVQLQNRAKNMWCYALIRDDVDSTGAIQRLHSLEMTGSRDDTLTIGMRALNLGFYYQSQFDSTQKYFDQAYGYLGAYYVVDDPTMQRYYRDLGSYYFFETNHVQKAIDLFKSEERLHKKWKYPPDERFLIAYNLGEVHRTLEDFDLAEKYQLQAIAEIRGTVDSASEIAILPYSSLCYLYAHRGDSTHLRAYVDTTLMLVRKHYSLNIKETMDYHSNLAMCYSPGYVNDPKRGMAILDRLSIDTHTIQKYPAAYGDVMRARAYLNLGSGNLSQAQTDMQKAINLYQVAKPLDPYYSGNYHDALLGLGALYLEDGKRTQEAMPFILKASKFVFDTTLNEVAENFPVQYFKYYARWYDYLIAYGDFLIKTHLSGEPLLKLMLLSDRIDSAIVTTRQKVSDNDVLRNARLSHDIYTYMIDWCHSMHQKSGADTLLHQAFDHFENSRAHLLLTQISTASLAKQYDVPDSVIDDGIKLTIEETTTALAVEGPGEMDPLLYRKQAYFNRLEKQYSEYYHQCYNPERATLTSVQQALGDHEAMISFQLRDSQLYSMVITSDTAALLKSNFNTICANAIDELNRIVHTKPSHAQGNMDVSLYAYTSAHVFDCVLGNVYDLISKKNQWWIAADGVLELLPFEILLRDNPENPSSFESLPYLVKDHTIGYILSATTWVKEVRKADAKIEQIAAFIHSDGTHTVRSLDQERDGLQYQGMPGTAKAAASIKKIFGSHAVKIYPNEKATTTTFKSALDQYDILHLGLHAYADTTGKQRHGIVFPGDNKPLQVSDLIGERISASIVFLEGCETGVGKQLRGEGLFNFARSFIAAGARQVLASRWKLHDQTAGEMSGYFYQQLKAGSDVAVANCEAKRMFLKNAGALQSHPYYWAAVMSVQ